MTAFSASETARFWAKVDRCAEGECWQWTAAKNNHGYGHMGFRQKLISAHRFSYALHKGELVPGLVVDHLCRNRACVNPAHLEQVTNEENLARGVHFFRNKTECPKGHAYDDTNVYLSKDGKRKCRECGRAQSRFQNKRRWAALRDTKTSELRRDLEASLAEPERQAA